MATPIKFKVIKKHPAMRQIEVQFYTDELVASVQTRKADWMANFLLRYPQTTQEELEDRGLREFPGGSITTVTIYPDPEPTGQELTDYILSYAPYTWIVHAHNCVVSPKTEVATGLEEGDEGQGVPAAVLRDEEIKAELNDLLKVR